MLLQHKKLFVTKKIFYSFTGYAHDQMRKMEKFAYNGYMGEKRKALVDERGYDSKNAAHLIRLLRMGIEFLYDGKLYVDRGSMDAEELLEIKAGKWTLKQVKEEAHKLFLKAEDAFDKSILPEEINYEKVNKLCVKILQNHFRNKIRI